MTPKLKTNLRQQAEKSDSGLWMALRAIVAMVCLTVLKLAVTEKWNWDEWVLVGGMLLVLAGTEGAAKLLPWFFRNK